MIKPAHLHRGDQIAIVSLSSGILGEPFCAHQVARGVKRLKDMGLNPVFMKHALKGLDFVQTHPELRAQDLKDAFLDPNIKGILCAIGGDETYKLLPYLMDDEVFIETVKKSPKIFLGFSDTTNNHLMFYKLGLTTYYGLSFLSDVAELDKEMMPYTKESFLKLFINEPKTKILPSPIWYEERTDYSVQAMDTPRISHTETKGYEVLYGKGIVSGKLLGGCLESLYDGYTGNRYPEQKGIYERYQLMPKKEDWKGKILFIETSEEKPSPELYLNYLQELERQGVFEGIRGMIVGKPQNEVHYDAYKNILIQYGKQYQIPILYNLNVGHAVPRTMIPYGLMGTIDCEEKTFSIDETMFDKGEI